MDKFFDNILEKIKRKSIIRRLITLIVSLFALSIVYNLFLLPTGLVAGGVNGIAVITNYVYGIDSSIMIFLNICWNYRRNCQWTNLQNWF